MYRWASKSILVLLSFSLTTLSGCLVSQPVPFARPTTLLSEAGRPTPIAQASKRSTISSASLLPPEPDNHAETGIRIVQAQDKAPSTGMNLELSVQEFVEEVLARNPSLAQMVAAWQAASARYPQVRSLDDPTFTGVIAPASFGSNAVEAGYRVELSQRFPFPGKLRLRGQAALAEAGAAGNDVEDMRVQLIEAAKTAFYDYFLVDRAREVNDKICNS